MKKLILSTLTLITLSCSISKSQTLNAVLGVGNSTGNNDIVVEYQHKIYNETRQSVMIFDTAFGEMDVFAYDINGIPSGLIVRRGAAELSADDGINSGDIAATTQGTFIGSNSFIDIHSNDSIDLRTTRIIGLSSPKVSVTDTLRLAHNAIKSLDAVTKQQLDTVASKSFFTMNFPLTTAGVTPFYGPGGANYYFGIIVTNGLNTTANNRDVYWPINAKLIGAMIHIRCTAGSSNNCTFSVRVNNTTDYTISSVVDLSVGNSVWSNFALNGGVGISGTRGSDFLEIKWHTPSSGSSPTSLTGDIQLIFKPN